MKIKIPEHWRTYRTPPEWEYLKKYQSLESFLMDNNIEVGEDDIEVSWIRYLYTDPRTAYFLTPGISRGMFLVLSRRNTHTRFINPKIWYDELVVSTLSQNPRALRCIPLERISDFVVNWIFATFNHSVKHTQHIIKYLCDRKCWNHLATLWSNNQKIFEELNLIDPDFLKRCYQVQRNPFRSIDIYGNQSTRKMRGLVI